MNPTKIPVKNFRYHCPFCDNDMTPFDGNRIDGYFDCLKCPVFTRFIVNGSTSSPDIIYIHFRRHNYLLELCLDSNHTYLFAEPDASSKRVLKLDHCPIITPQTVDDWLLKLINLKAFS